MCYHTGIESTELVADFVTTAGAMGTDDEDDDERKSENGKVKGEKWQRSLRPLQRKRGIRKEIKTLRPLRPLRENINHPVIVSSHTKDTNTEAPSGYFAPFSTAFICS